MVLVVYDVAYSTEVVCLWYVLYLPTIIIIFDDTRNDYRSQNDSGHKIVQASIRQMWDYAVMCCWLFCFKRADKIEEYEKPQTATSNNKMPRYR